MFSSGHDLGSKASLEERMPGPNQHPTFKINGGTRLGAENLMLQEWHYFFDNTRRWRNLRKITIGQAHGDVYAAGLMLLWACDLIVAAETRPLSPTSSAPGSACAASSTSPTRGSSGRARPRSCCSPATRSSADEAHRLGMVSKVFPADELTDRTARIRPPHRQAADHARPAHQGVGQPVASTTWASTTRSTPASPSTS